MAVQREKRPEIGERYRSESYDELFPGRFLKAGLFKGKEVTLRIADVYQELMPDKKGTILSKKGDRCKKQTIFVVETPQGRRLEQEVAINKTNAVACLLMFGKSLPAWIGRLVTFAPRIVDAFGEEKEAIRIVGSPELPNDLERSARLGQADKTFRLKKTPMPPNVRVVPPPAPAAPPPPKDEIVEQEQEQEEHSPHEEPSPFEGEPMPEPEEGDGDGELEPIPEAPPL